MFSQVSVHPHLRERGGVLHPRSGRGGGVAPFPGLDGGGEFLIPGLDGGGTPSQIWTGGYPIPDLDRGGTIPGLDRGVPHPRSGGRYPRTGWGTPQSKTGWGTPTQDWIGYPPLGLDGVPPPIQVWMGYGYPVRRQSSLASTCYTKGSMPLAFMQEDFLVWFMLSFGVKGPLKLKHQWHLLRSVNYALASEATLPRESTTNIENRTQFHQMSSLIWIFTTISIFRAKSTRQTFHPH